MIKLKLSQIAKLALLLVHFLSSSTVSGSLNPKSFSTGLDAPITQDNASLAPYEDAVSQTDVEMYAGQAEITGVTLSTVNEGCKDDVFYILKNEPIEEIISRLVKDGQIDKSIIQYTCKVTAEDGHGETAISYLRNYSDASHLATIRHYNGMLFHLFKRIIGGEEVLMLIPGRESANAILSAFNLDSGEGLTVEISEEDISDIDEGVLMFESADGPSHISVQDAFKISVRSLQSMDLFPSFLREITGSADVCDDFTPGMITVLFKQLTETSSFDDQFPVASPRYY
jgi:hypothetical protein